MPNPHTFHYLRILKASLARVSFWSIYCAECPAKAIFGIQRGHLFQKNLSAPDLLLVGDREFHLEYCNHPTSSVVVMLCHPISISSSSVLLYVPTVQVCVSFCLLVGFSNGRNHPEMRSLEERVSRIFIQTLSVVTVAGLALVQFHNVTASTCHFRPADDNFILFPNSEMHRF